MSCKKYVVLAMLLLALLKMGTALKCQQCLSLSSKVGSFKCNATTVECPTGQCYTVSITDSLDQSAVAKGCAPDNLCGDLDKLCKRISTSSSYKSCDGSCCSTDFCNTAEGIMAVKAFICLMAIVGYFLA